MSDSLPPRLYAGWAVERWDTPVSDAQSLRLVSLADDGALRLTLEDGLDPARRRWRVTFADAPAYLNVREEYRLELWEAGGSARGLGWTVRVPGSPWLSVLRRAEALVDVHHPGLVHYQIGTEDNVIDVFSATAPSVEEVEPAPPDSPPVGKSRILFHPRDRAEMEQLVADVAAQARGAGPSSGCA